MAFRFYILIFNVLVFAESATANVDPSSDYKCDCKGIPIKRSSFKEGFIFGASSSAYQIEEKIPGEKKNGDVAADSYHRYKDDLEATKQIGLDVYRFSISWSRILPNGTLSGGINYEGIQYYNNLIDELLANGIEPHVTIFHFDVPQALEDLYGGFLSPRIVEDFVGYADLLFHHFGDKVKRWYTFNEPFTFSRNGYAIGIYAPGRCSSLYNVKCTGGDSGIEPYLVAHNELLAHAATFRLYKEKYQVMYDGMVGMALVTPWYVPFDKEKDDGAWKVAIDFTFGWFMNPITFGDYPESMKERVGDRLPIFTDEEKIMLIGSYDFIGLNYYTGMFARFFPEEYEPTHLNYYTDSGVNLTSVDINGNYLGGGPAYNLSWIYIYPRGLRELLNYIKMSYNNPKIYITENGVSFPSSMPLHETLNDAVRVDYIAEHLCCVHNAIANGSNVDGYMVWALIDNFEWDVGYTERFGLYYVDFDSNLERVPKRSAIWLKEVLAKAAASALIQENPIRLPINQV